MIINVQKSKWSFVKVISSQHSKWSQLKLLDDPHSWWSWLNVAGCVWAYQEAKEEELSPCLHDCLQPIAKQDKSFTYVFNNYEKVFCWTSNIFDMYIYSSGKVLTLSKKKTAGPVPCYRFCLWNSWIILRFTYTNF